MSNVKGARKKNKEDYDKVDEEDVSIVWKGLSDKVIFEQRLEGYKENHAGIWGNLSTLDIRKKKNNWGKRGEEKEARRRQEEGT